MNFHPDFNGWTIHYSGDWAALFNSGGVLVKQGSYGDVEEHIVGMLPIKHIETRLPKGAHRFPNTVAEAEALADAEAMRLDKIAALEAELQLLRES